MISDHDLKKINEERRRKKWREISRKEAEDELRRRNEQNMSTDFMISYLTGFPYPSPLGAMLSPQNQVDYSPPASSSPSYSSESHHSPSYSSSDYSSSSPDSPSSSSSSSSE